MNDKVELGWLLQQLAAIQSETGYLQAIISELSNLDAGELTKAEVLGDIVRCRETTNQQLIDFYKRIYVEQFTHRADEA